MPQLLDREVTRIDPIDSSPTDGPAYDHSVELQGSKRFLDHGEPRSQSSRQLARIALPEELEPQKDSGSRPAAKGTGFRHGLHRRSYDRY